MNWRVVSALVLVPIVVAATVAGTPFFELLAAAVTLAMSWEWARICNAGRFAGSGYWFAAATLVAVAAAAWGRYDLALAALGAGTIATFAAARAAGRAAPWMALGVIAVGLPMVALLKVQAGTPDGVRAVLWLFGAVWATDVGAFYIGRRLGGPRLAPVISPRKTWAGLAGGAACAVAWSLLWGWWAGVPSVALLGAIGVGAAILAQAGDLGVSVVKRRFGVKDSSRLIPGHGGVLDRVDGLLVTASAMAGLTLASQGGKLSWL